eukprot:2791019-Pyramimonas_sp.AAC.1
MSATTPFFKRVKRPSLDKSTATLAWCLLPLLPASERALFKPRMRGLPPPGGGDGTGPRPAVLGLDP